MNDAEVIFWAEVEALPEHKRTFDSDVVDVILKAMSLYALKKVNESKTEES